VLGSLTISVLDGVRSLVVKSLLRFSADGKGEPRLSLLELVRAYALERLAECGELEQVRDAHAAYYLEFAEKASALANANQVAQEGLEWEVGNMRASLEWLLERKKGEEALRLAAALGQFWSLSEYRSRGRSFLEEALEDSEQNQRPVSPTVQAGALYDRGEGRMTNALLGEGVKLYREISENNDTESTLKKEGAESSPLEALPESRTVFPVRITEPLLLSAYAELTAREIEVLRLLATGLSNKRIAERLIVSPHTVNGHIHSIFGKLAVHSRSAATRYALDHQLA
jgi:DNA-binding CsgD family transcriptional regulator